MPLLSTILLMLSSQDHQLDDAVSKAISTYMQQGESVGLSIGVYHDGRRYFYNAGTKRMGAEMLPTNRTQYCIASITKTFTAALLAQAAIEGKVHLDDDVRKYLKGKYPNLEVNGTRVRLWQLLNHNSGMPNFLPDVALAWQQPGYDAAKSSVVEAEQLRRYSRSDFLRDLHGVKLAYEPGTRYSYSNAGAQLVGLVLEGLYGKPYQQLVQTRIFDPLGMKHTGISLTQAEIADLPRAYNGTTPFLPALSDAMPEAAGIKSTTEDMMKYIVWNMKEADAATRMVHQSPGHEKESGYYHGLNWQEIRSGSIRKLFQYGNVPGFHSACVIYPELKLGIIVLSNGQAPFRPAPLDPLVNAILGSIDPHATLMPE